MHGVSRSADSDAAAVQAPLGPQQAAETTARRTTRSLRRQQSAYEDRARAIQKHIDSCREAYEDAKDFIEEFRPTARDSHQRTTQLVTQYRNNIALLQRFAHSYDALIEEWTGLLQLHEIPQDFSDWAESMRRQHDDFFGQTPHLDAQFQELIATYREYLGRAKHQLHDLPPSPELGKGLPPTMQGPRPQASAGVQPTPEGSPPTMRVPEGSVERLRFPENEDDGDEDESTTTNASSGKTGEAHGTPPVADNAGEGTPEADPPRQDRNADNNTSAEQRRVRIRDTPEVHELRDLSLRSEDDEDDFFFEAPTVPLRRREPAPSASERRDTPTLFAPRSSRPADTRPRPLYYGNPSMYGLFAESDGLLSEASPIAWRNAHSGNGQHHETYVTYGPPARSRNDYPEGYRRSPLYRATEPAANAAPNYRVADNATGRTGDGHRSRRSSPPRSPPPMQAVNRMDHRERMQDGYRTAETAGRGYFGAPSYASADSAYGRPSPAAWTSQPPNSAAYAQHRPQSHQIDYGVDFARENASKFYQNGTYHRSASNRAPPLVLKELPIQKFRGEIRTYQAFRNRFLETVGTREDLEPRHKFQYLLDCLDGEPLRLANGYLITDSNYYKLLDRLEDRYGDKATLSTLLGQDFFNLKPVGPATKDLRRFHDEVLRIVDQMEQIGEDLTGSIWRNTLISKMPRQLRAKIYESMSQNPMTASVQTILARVSDYLRLLEQSEIAFTGNFSADGNSGQSSRPCHSDPRSTAQRTGTFVTDADVTYAANEKKAKKCICAFCGRSHWASQCDIYATVNQRYKRARQLKYCLLCLRTGHWAAKCHKKTDDACKHCHGLAHHRALCTGKARQGRQPFASPRHSPVRAPRPGPQGDPTNEQGSSSQQENRDTISVSRLGGQGPPTAKTVRFPSTQHSSPQGGSNSKIRRRKRSKDPRTDPQGRDGTTRPTTDSAAENVKQMGASACGGDGLLPEHQDHLTTDRRSTTAEAPWDDPPQGDGFSLMQGILNTPRECGPWAEEASLPPSPGHCSDADTEPSSDELDDDDPRFAPTNNIFQDYSGYAVSTSSPADNRAVLLECLRTTAVNIDNGLSRSAIVFFDSGSNCSYISMELARDLRLPCLENRLIRVNTFGTDATTTISGFATTVLLRSPHGATVALALNASKRIVPPITTALINDDEVALLKRNACSLISTRETPDLLIGHDLVDLFNRRDGPKLPNGFKVFWSDLGPILGGAGKVASHWKAASNTHAAATLDSEPLGATSTMPPSAVKRPRPSPRLGYNPEDPLNLWTMDDNAPGPADNAGREAGVTASGPADNAGSGRGAPTVVEASTLFCRQIEDDGVDLLDLCGSKAPATLFLGSRSQRPQAQWPRQRSPRKKRNPLDTHAEPLPPTITNTFIVAADPPQLPSEPILPSEMQQSFGPAPSPLAAPRADPLSDQSTHADDEFTDDQHSPAAADARPSVKGTGAADNAALLPAEAQPGAADNAAPAPAPHAPAFLRARPTVYLQEDTEQADMPTSPVPTAILEHAAHGNFKKPGTVQGAADNAAPEPSSVSAKIAAQNPRVPDTEVATDASAPPEPTATPDAALSSTTDAPTIAAPAASQAVSAIITDIDARIAPLLTSLAELKDPLLKFSATTSGPSAPTRSPETDPERDD